MPSSTDSALATNRCASAVAPADRRKQRRFGHGSHRGTERQPRGMRPGWRPTADAAPSENCPVALRRGRIKQSSQSRPPFWHKWPIVQLTQIAAVKTAAIFNVHRDTNSRHALLLAIYLTRTLRESPRTGCLPRIAPREGHPCSGAGSPTPCGDRQSFSRGGDRLP